MKWLLIIVSIVVIFIIGCLVIAVDNYKEKNTENIQPLPNVMIINNLSMYTYKLTPDSFTLSKEKLEQLFAMLENAREEFNVGLLESQQAFPVSEYALAIAPVNSSETHGEVVAVYAFPLEYAQQREDWFEGVVRGGYAFEHAVDGGGNAYFEARVNLTTGNVVKFTTHAEGIIKSEPDVTVMHNGYQVVFLPSAFRLSESELKTTFELLEQARSDFNTSVSADRVAFELEDYMLAFVPVNPAQAGRDKVLAVFGVSKEKAGADSQWINNVLLRDGYALGLGVRDGGSLYFSAEINLITGSSTFSTNGSA